MCVICVPACAWLCVAVVSACVLRVGLSQVGISMLQIIASANSVYDIPWPTSFSAFMDVMKLFQVDLLTITKANCTVRLDYYQSLLLTLLLFKVGLRRHVHRFVLE